MKARSNSNQRFLLLALCGLNLLLSNPAVAAEIAGIVKSSTKKYATVVVKGDLVPVPGDKAQIYFKIPGADVDVSVATGHVYEITGGDIMIEIEKTSGIVAKGQLVRITAPNPKKNERAPKSGPSLPPNRTATSSATASPSPNAKPPSSVVAASPSVAAPSPHAPALNSAEALDIHTAARNYFIGKYVKEALPQPVIFKADHLLVSDRFANIEGAPSFQDGSKAIPKYAPNIGYNFCLQHNSNGWTVIGDLSRGDVPDATQTNQLRASLPADFPLAVFSPQWRKLFATVTH